MICRQGAQQALAAVYAPDRLQDAAGRARLHCVQAGPVHLARGDDRRWYVSVRCMHVCMRAGMYVWVCVCPSIPRSCPHSSAPVSVRLCMCVYARPVLRHTAPTLAHKESRPKRILRRDADPSHTHTKAQMEWFEQILKNHPAADGWKVSIRMYSCCILVFAYIAYPRCVRMYTCIYDIKHICHI